MGIVCESFTGKIDYKLDCKMKVMVEIYNLKNKKNKKNGKKLKKNIERMSRKVLMEKKKYNEN